MPLTTSQAVARTLYMVGYYLNLGIPGTDKLVTATTDGEGYEPKKDTKHAEQVTKYGDDIAVAIATSAIKGMPLTPIGYQAITEKAWEVIRDKLQYILVNPFSKAPTAINMFVEGSQYAAYLYRELSPLADKRDDTGMYLPANQLPVNPKYPTLKFFKQPPVKMAYFDESYEPEKGPAKPSILETRPMNPNEFPEQNVTPVQLLQTNWMYITHRIAKIFSDYADVFFIRALGRETGRAQALITKFTGLAKKPYSWVLHQEAYTLLFELTWDESAGASKKSGISELQDQKFFKAARAEALDLLLKTDPILLHARAVLEAIRDQFVFAYEEVSENQQKRWKSFKKFNQALKALIDSPAELRSALNVDKDPMRALQMVWKNLRETLVNNSIEEANQVKRDKGIENGDGVVAASIDSTNDNDNSDSETVETSSSTTSSSDIFASSTNFAQNLLIASLEQQANVIQSIALLKDIGKVVDSKLPKPVNDNPEQSTKNTTDDDNERTESRLAAATTSRAEDRVYIKRLKDLKGYAEVAEQQVIKNVIGGHFSLQPILSIETDAIKNIRSFPKTAAGAASTSSTSSAAIDVLTGDEENDLNSFTTYIRGLHNASQSIRLSQFEQPYDVETKVNMDSVRNFGRGLSK